MVSRVAPEGLDAVLPAGIAVPHEHKPLRLVALGAESGGAPGAMLLAPLEHRRVQEGGGARAVAAGERLARGGRGDVGQLGPHDEVALVQVDPRGSMVYRRYICIKGHAGCPNDYAFISVAFAP